MKIIKTSRDFQGDSLVELALTMPLLMAVLFGVLDLGRVFFATITMTSAAREGVRYLSVYPEDVSNETAPFFSTKQIAIQEAGDSGISLLLGDVDVSCANIDDDPDYCDSGAPAIVTVTHDFDLVLGWFLPSPIQIERTGQMVVP